MPVHPVKNKEGDIIGYQWGSSGKIYKGKGAKKKAEVQGRAAYASGYTGKSFGMELYPIKIFNDRTFDGL